MTDKSREAFEALASDNGQSHKAVERSQNGNYKLMQTNSLWMGWAAGYRQATEACVAAAEGERCAGVPVYNMAVENVVRAIKELK